MSNLNLREKGEGKTERLFEAIIAKIFLQLMKIIKLQFQEAQISPRRINTHTKHTKTQNNQTLENGRNTLIQSYCLMGTEFLFGIMKKIWNWIVVMVD